MACEMHNSFYTYKFEKQIQNYRLKNCHQIHEIILQMYEGIIENEKRRTLLAMVTAMDEAAEVDICEYSYSKCLF